MIPKTETTGAGTNEEKKSEFSPMFLRWLVSLTIVTLLFLFFGDYVFPRNAVRLAFIPVPWTMAGGFVIEQALDLFSGRELPPISMEKNIAMLTGLLMAFVIGPTLLFFSWRRLLTGPKQSKLNPSIIGFVFGVIFMSSGVLGTIASAIIHPQVAASMREAQALGENRDEVISGMRRVSLDAYQYKIMPKSYAGGGGSYMGYEVPSVLRKLETNEFIATSVTDTCLTITGSSTKYPGAGVQGVYDRQGRLFRTFSFMGSFR